MPVNTPSAAYKAMESAWKRCRDVYDGSDAVKAAKDAYLPRLECHAADTNTVAGGKGYDSYVSRALFYPAFRRTVVGLGGLVCGQAPTVDDMPEAYRTILDDVTQTGVSLAGFAYSLCHDILSIGRGGALVDLPESAVGASVQPRWCVYRAEDILQVRTTRINGQEALSLVVLREAVEREKDGDPFTSEFVETCRVLALRDGKYTVQVWAQDATDKGKYLPGEERTPLRRGVALDFIPFTCLSPTTVTTAIEQPPLLALADVNLSHYRTSADREHGAHYTALPTPYITGHTVQAGGRLGIGSGEAWVFPNENAKAGMVEFSGAGLESLATLMEEKRGLMTTLGARMLETQKIAQEAAETVRLRRAGESSELSVLAQTIGHALSRLLRWSLFWSGVDQAVADKATVQMQPDLLERLGADDVRVLVSSWQAGAISHATVYANLEAGRWTRENVPFEQEQKDIEAEGQDTAPLTDALPFANSAVHLSNGQSPACGETNGIITKDPAKVTCPDCKAMMAADPNADPNMGKGAKGKPTPAGMGAA